MGSVIERIWINEILGFINKKDYRSAISWCTRNGVKLLKDGVNRYALREDFEKAYNTTAEGIILAPVNEQATRRYQPKSKLACQSKMNNNE